MVASKLNLKPGDSYCIVNAPHDLTLDLGDELESTDRPDEADAVIVFVIAKADLDDHVRPALDAALQDRLAWIAYPKAGQLGAEVNRDTLREELAGVGVRPVRQISIDETWSALRFRPA